MGSLGLIKDRFPEGILVPEGVWTEVVEQGRDRPGALEVESTNWITVNKVSDHDFVNFLKNGLDQGEAEAICLARESKADIVLLDERDAREVAKRFKFRILGTLGLLIWAKRTGRITNLKECLNNLQDQGKFRISQKLYEYALREAGEL